MNAALQPRSHGPGPSKGPGRHLIDEADPWSDLPWEEHAEARRIVAMYPDGMLLEEIAVLLGVTREYVRLLELNALRKLRMAAGNDVITVDGFNFTVPHCRVCGELFVLRKGRDPCCPLHSEGYARRRLARRRWFKNYRAKKRAR